MKNLFSLPNFLILLFMFTITACYRAPEFPAEPSISFKSLKFYDVPITEIPPQDSLVLTITFHDGDGDIGLSGTELDIPYQPFTFVRDKSGNFLTPSSNDTMPPFVPPYECINYKTGKFSQGYFIYYSTVEDSDYQRIFADKSPDTLYTKPNFFTDNFIVDFLVKREGRYEVFDFITAPPTGCGETQNGRVPIFDAIDPGKPLSGELTYIMKSLAFVPYFRNDTVKLQVRLIDRALNISNTMETPPFYFTQNAGKYQIELIEE